MEIIGTVFKGTRQHGDFIWMMKQPEYKNSLFIFNDNTEYHNTNHRGAGNAVMRTYNKYNKYLDKPISAGIPTGSLKDGGFEILDDKTKNIIDESIDEIKKLIKQYKYDKIIYSAHKKENGILGTSIFEVDKIVINYITEQIKSLI